MYVSRSLWRISLFFMFLCCARNNTTLKEWFSWYSTFASVQPLCPCSDKDVAQGASGNDPQLTELAGGGSVVARCSLQLHHSQMSAQPRAGSAGRPAPWHTLALHVATQKLTRTWLSLFKTVLNDSAQIRTTLRGFSSVLDEMAQVYDVAALREQLSEADRRVSAVQGSFATPLSQLEHAAAVSLAEKHTCTPDYSQPPQHIISTTAPLTTALITSPLQLEFGMFWLLTLTSIFSGFFFKEVEAIEGEVRKMENDVDEIKAFLCSPESFRKNKRENLKVTSFHRSIIWLSEWWETAK